MSRLRASRPVLAWLALLAVLMATLAPAVSQALGAHGPTSWIEVCTANGARLVRLDEPGPQAPAAPADAHLLGHCPYCALHVDTLAPPPAPTAQLAVAQALAHALPAAFLHAPRTAAVWCSAQPRAPPFQS